MKKNKTIEDLLTRGIKEVVSRESLIGKLESGRTLKIKHGVDPTTAKLHFGYWVVYRKLRKLQEMGHRVQLLIGSFTAQIGDPEGKIESRRPRTLEEVEAISSDYLKQVSKVLDLEKIDIYRNNDWFGGMLLSEFFKIASHFSVWGLLERDMFQERKKMAKELRPAEFMYPILQAYDSVKLESDLTVIGSDQIFNEVQARLIQKAYGQAPQDILATQVLIGLDGKNKMSQSLGNIINLDDAPEDKFGKIMSLSDHCIPHYFELLTDRDMAEINASTKNPRDLKEELAIELIGELDGKAEAIKARDAFVKVFREHKTPDTLESFVVSEPITLKDVVFKSGLASSRAEAQRLIEEGAVSLDKEVIKDWGQILEIKKPVVLQVGKRRFIKLLCGN